MINSVNDLKSKYGQNIDSVAARQNRAIQVSLLSIQHKYLIACNKRGIGKTSLAANLAVTLSKRKAKVGLMGLDLEGTGIEGILGLERSYRTDTDKRFIPQTYSDYLKVISIESVMKNVDPTVIWRGDLKTHVIRQFIADINWGKMDYLIVDAPPAVGAPALAVAQAIQGAKVIFVSTPEKESLPQVRELINFYKSSQVSVLGVIENKSGFWCRKCDKSGKTTLSESIILDVNYLGRIPIDPHMPDCTAAEQSYLKKHPDSEAAHGYGLVADKVEKDSRAQRAVVRKIAVPTAEERLFPYFGQATEFAIFQVGDRGILKKEILHPPPHGPNVFPDWLQDLGVDVVITKNIGQNAIENFKANGIKVITNSKILSPAELVQRYLLRGL